MFFLTQTHQDRFNALIQRDRTVTSDVECRAMFFIFSGVDDLYAKVNHLYDFDDHLFMPETLEENTVDLTRAMRALVKVAYNLYNGYPADVRATFEPLDAINKRLVTEALRIRFHMEG